MTNTEDTAAIDPTRIADLVERCGEGDPVAMAEFFEAYAEDIYNFPIKVFHLDSDAASDFFLYAFERLRDGGRFRSFQGRSRFRTWFYTVLRNMVIDWMRTIREVNTVQLGKPEGSTGSEYRMIENAADPRSVVDGSEQAILDSFQSGLGQLSLELRAILKLSYIYYLHLDDEELTYVAEKSGKAPEELLSYLADLKNSLADKEIKNLGAEDKITSLYMSILDLKTKRDRLAGPGDPDSEGVDPYELERLDRAIEKKYKQREKLIGKRERGHYTVRTPYRYVTELLGIPEGSVSVQMMRALNRLRQEVGGDAQ